MNGLVYQSNIDHKMWDVVSMAEEGMYRGIRPFEKAANLLGDSPVIKTFLRTIQADLSFTPLY